MVAEARVLVTEDDNAVRGVILRVLSQNGYEVLEACHMQQALECWHATEPDAPIDLLITDLMMPGGTGVELAEALWSVAPQLPVLFMSGYGDDIEPAEPTERVVHLPKPFNTAQLLGHVEQLLRVTRASRGADAP